MYAVGANKGDKFFTDGGDVDTAAAVLTVVDDTLVVVTATRYNGGGHDVRWRSTAPTGRSRSGWTTPMRSRPLRAGVTFPPGPHSGPSWSASGPAYRAELTAFAQVARGDIPSPCSVADALRAFRTARRATGP